MKPEKTTNPDKSIPREDPDLPFWVELGFTFPVILLITLDLAVIAVSYSAGARWFDIFIRTIVTTISAGLVLWLLAMNWSNGMLEGMVRAALDKNQPSEVENKPSQVMED